MATAIKADYYTRYICLGGRADGRTFPRTAEGLAAATATDADCIRPFRPRSAGITRHDIATADSALADLDDYDGLVDHGNAGPYVKP